MLDHIREAVAAYEAKRTERDRLPRAAVLIALYEWGLSPRAQRGV